MWSPAPTVDFATERGEYVCVSCDVYIYFGHFNNIYESQLIGLSQSRVNRRHMSPNRDSKHNPFPQEFCISDRAGCDKSWRAYPIGPHQHVTFLPGNAILSSLQNFKLNVALFRRN